MAELERREPDRSRVGAPRGVVLVMHGGAQSGHRPVDERSASLWRARLLRDAISHPLLASGHALWLLRFSVRGWNGPARPSPVPDARWALDQVRETHPALPVVLLGHSMGARTAVHVADDRQVVGVVGLAPWLGPNDPVEPLRGRRLILGHGSRDKITRAAGSEAFVRRARHAGVDASFHDLGPLGHYMLTHRRRWNDFALEQSLTAFSHTSLR